jgi:hypothetical protein
MHLAFFFFISASKPVFLAIRFPNCSLNPYVIVNTIPYLCNFFLFILLVGFCFLGKSLYVPQAGHELNILLPHFPKCWDDRHEPLSTASHFCLKHNCWSCPCICTQLFPYIQSWWMAPEFINQPRQKPEVTPDSSPSSTLSMSHSFKEAAGSTYVFQYTVGTCNTRHVSTQCLPSRRESYEGVQHTQFSGFPHTSFSFYR